MEVDPTLTPELNPFFSVAFLVGFVFLLVLEVWGIRRRGTGDTISEHWRAADAWLKARTLVGRWAFRVGTAGLLVWTLLHFLLGAD